MPEAMLFDAHALQGGDLDGRRPKQGNVDAPQRCRAKLRQKTSLLDVLSATFRLGGDCIAILLASSALMLRTLPL